MRRRQDFSELLVCRGEADPGEQTATLRVYNDDEALSPPFTVAINDLAWVNMPIPASADKRGHTALVACRVVELQSDTLIVEVPVFTGVGRFTVQQKNLAHPYIKRST